MTKVTLDSLTIETLSDRVYSAIRGALLRGAFAAGTFVRESDVASDLGVSRTPVREALARLAQEGFVERIAHRGYRVPQVGVTELLELYPIVGALEVLAGETSLARLTPQDIDALRAINRDFREAGEVGDGERGLAANNRFHHVLSERCGNERLCALLDELRGQVMRLELWSARHPAHAVEAGRQHEEILALVEDGNYAQALELLRINRLQTYTEFKREIGDAVVSGENA